MNVQRVGNRVQLNDVVIGRNYMWIRNGVYIPVTVLNITDPGWPIGYLTYHLDFDRRLLPIYNEYGEPYPYWAVNFPIYNAQIDESPFFEDLGEQGYNFLIPPENPPLKNIVAGSTDIVSFEDIEEGSIVGQIVGEGGSIAKSYYYFPDTLTELLEQRRFQDPATRERIVDVKWYRAHLVPARRSGGKTRRKIRSKRTRSKKYKRSA